MEKYKFTGKKDTRSGFRDSRAEFGKTIPDVVALCAGLEASLKLDTFIKDKPQVLYNVVWPKRIIFS